MFFMDLPDTDLQYQPIMVAQAEQAAKADPALMRTIGVCAPVPKDEYSAENGIDPKLNAAYYLRSYEQLEVPFNPPAVLTILEQPKHGVLHLVTEDDRGTLFGVTAGPLASDAGLYAYFPDKDYVGDDKAVFLIELQDVKVKVVYFFQSIPGGTLGNYGLQEYCEKTGYRWKISSTINSNGTATVDSVSYIEQEVGQDEQLDISGLETWLANLGRNSYLGEGFNLTMAPMQNGALGESVGSTITLDDNANGFGWYIDLTPGLNEEFLPTANPYEWKAKPGSAAEGKVDLLTVLLHEAAHTLGYDHTNDSHALMAPTLEPGIRRLPSAELLAELQGLTDQEVAVSMNNPDDPLPMPNPIPFTGFGAFWAGRLRKSGYGYLLESVGVNNDREIQYAVTPNPTLLNPEFAAVDGWNLTGDVALAGNAAVLRESATDQTRLNQVFTLNPGDRFLRFTLDGINLDDVNGAPDDAFEVALIDANTNQSLLSSDGLTHSDAAINLQADGGQHLATEVSYTDNADGSRTYLLDLSGITSGTAVSLSFDLIGFGRNEAANNSQITIRDLRLGIPETVDDAVTTAEDTALTINALANDLDADQPGFTPVVVADPSHGQLVINPDGSFDYTPDQDWSGEDSFSYLLSDGSADSNTSTVTVTVTPVNDAPLASDANLTMLEDEALTINLAGYGSDVDSTSLTAQVVSGPSNGIITQYQDGTFSFAANANFHGVDSFSYLISDRDLTSVTAVVTIDVVSVNDAPSGADNTVTTLEDSAYAFQITDFGFSDVNDDVQGSTNAGGGTTPGAAGNNFANVIIDQLPTVGSLTLSGVALTARQTVSVTDIVAGNLVFNPVANANGSNYASFTFRVQDDAGTANGGADTDPLARTMTIDVTSVNDAPSGADNTVVTLEDTAYTFQESDFGFSDILDGNSFANVIIDSVPVAGSLTLNGAAVTVGQTVSVADIVAGNLVFAPVANQNGAGYAAFTFRVQDNDGSANGGADTDPLARTMTIDVTSVNDAPSGSDNTVVTLEDTAYTFQESDFGFSDILDGNSFAGVIIDSIPATGSLTLNGAAVTAGQTVSVADIVAGNLVFAPVANQNGAGYAAFTFRVQDSDGTANGGVDTDPLARTMIIDVTSVNDAPSGADNTVITLEDTTYVFQVADFGFSDILDGNSFANVIIDSVPAAGSLTVSGFAVTAGQTVSVADIVAGNLVFAPVANQNGAGYAAFTFRVQDKEDLGVRDLGVSSRDLGVSSRDLGVSSRDLGVSSRIVT